MTQARPRAIFIGLKVVGEYLEKIRPEWDFLPHVETISELWTGLSNQTIDNNIDIILVLDKFFDPRGNDQSFEKLVATMGSYCFLGIVNYYPKNQEHMREQIGNEAYSTGDSETLLYYFISHKTPNPDIDAALESYIQNPKANQNVVAVLTGRTTEEEKLANTEEENVEKDFIKENEKKTEYLGQVLACTSSKGGSGKSTVATTLATYIAHASVNSAREGLAERPLKVIVVDLDLRDGQLGFLTGNSKPTIIQLRVQGISDETIEETVIHSPKLKCDLLLAPKLPRYSDDIPPEFFVELIHALRSKYDYIILDTSVNYLDPLLEKVAYPIADQIVFITDISIQSVFSMTRWIQEVTKLKSQNGMGINRRKIGIVVNKALSDVHMPGEKINKAALHLPVITVIPSNPKLVAHATNLQDIQILLKHKDLYPAIRRLARAVVGKNYVLSDNVN